MAPLTRALAETRAARPGRLLLIVYLSEAISTDYSILTPLCDAWYDCRARSGWLRIVYGNHATDLVVWEGRTADPALPAFAGGWGTDRSPRNRPRSATT
ncbi:hypothetical protein [Streptomyces sp. NPDC001307]|uniref:hypothetical protein n=1 Tax=Streptomyces sp. NPDC001307 TaxID=3364560 RepID=UPI0036ABBB2E